MLEHAQQILELAALLRLHSRIVGLGLRRHKEVEHRIQQRNGREASHRGTHNGCGVDGHHRRLGEVQHQHRRGGGRGSVVHLAHSRRIRHRGVDGGRVTAVGVVAQQVGVHVLRGGAAGAIVVIVAQVRVSEDVVAHAVLVTVRRIVVAVERKERNGFHKKNILKPIKTECEHLRKGGTVPREGYRKAKLGHELLGSVLVAIVRDIAIVISVTRLAHVQIHVETVQIGTTVRVGVRVVVAGVLYKKKRRNKNNVYTWVE